MLLPRQATAKIVVGLLVSLAWKFWLKPCHVFPFSEPTCQGTTQAFYLLGAQFFIRKSCCKRQFFFARPGVAPVEYTDGARVEMKVNKPSSQIQFFVASVVYRIFVGSTDCMRLRYDGKLDVFLKCHFQSDELILLYFRIDGVEPYSF